MQSNLNSSDTFLSKLRKRLWQACLKAPIIIIDLLGAVLEAVFGLVGCLIYVVMFFVVIALCSGVLTQDWSWALPDEIEGFVTEVKVVKIEPTDDELRESLRIYNEKAEIYKKNEGREYPWAYRPPKPYTATVVKFEDGREVEFKGISPKPLPVDKYLKIMYNKNGIIAVIEEDKAQVVE